METLFIDAGEPKCCEAMLGAVLKQVNGSEEGMQEDVGASVPLVLTLHRIRVRSRTLVRIELLLDHRLRP